MHLTGMNYMYFVGLKIKNAIWDGTPLHTTYSQNKIILIHSILIVFLLIWAPSSWEGQMHEVIWMHGSTITCKNACVTVFPADEPAPVSRRVSGRRPYHLSSSYKPYAKSSLGRSKRLPGSLRPVSRQIRSGLPLDVARSDVTPPSCNFPPS